MGTTVQDVLEGNGEDVGLLGTGKVGDVDVERDTLLSGSSLGNSQGDTEDGVGAKLGLVGGAIEVDEELVNLGLVLDVDVGLNQLRADDGVHVLDGLGDTLAGPLGLVTIAELDSLVHTGGRTGGNRSAEAAWKKLNGTVQRLDIIFGGNGDGAVRGDRWLHAQNP